MMESKCLYTGLCMVAHGSFQIPDIYVDEHYVVVCRNVIVSAGESVMVIYT